MTSARIPSSAHRGMTVSALNSIEAVLRLEMDVLGRRFADGEFDGLHPQRNAFQEEESSERDEKARSRTDFRV